MGVGGENSEPRRLELTEGKKGDAIINDKLNITPKDIWAVLLAAAATAICAAIDMIFKEENKHEP